MIRAALAYFLPVFALAFGLGVLRVLVVAPLTSPLLAVAAELPLILAASWLVAGRVLDRWPLALPGRIAMGATAFAFLMLAELALAATLGPGPRQFLADMAQPQGLLGLAGQLAFAAIPALRQPRG